MSKGQMQHVFTFILFIVIAGFLVIVGFNAISKVIGGSCDNEKIAFSQQMVSAFDKYDDYGAVHKETFHLPCNYNMVCFIDSGIYGNPSWNAGSDSLATRFQSVLDTAKSTKQNIFLVGEFAEPAGYSDKVKVGGSGQLCVDSRVANLVFTGQGRTTAVVEG